MKSILLFAAILLINCSYAAQNPGIYKWKNEQWDQWLISSIKESGVLDYTPRDIAQFAPSFSQYTEQEKALFWGHLMVLVAEKESSFNPNTSYTENFVDSTGTKVVSRGLYQLSYDSATISYKCDNIDRRDDLYLPQVNINCAVKILSYWLRRDQVISGLAGANMHRGAARYWSTLRQGNKKLASIQTQLKKAVIDFGKSFQDAGQEVVVDAASTSWSRSELIPVLLQELEQSKLIDVKLKNSKGYIGNYNSYSRDQRLYFWMEFLIWIDERIRTSEVFGLSPALEREYRLASIDEQELRIKKIVEILQAIILNDQMLTGYSSSSGKPIWKGAARLWSELKDLDEVKAQLNAITSAIEDQ